MELRLFSSIFYIFLLLIPLSLPADELSAAQDYEKTGQVILARQSYIKWLANGENSDNDSYGRILIHALRIAGTVQEDLELIDRFHGNLALADDKLDIYETAVVLTELTSDREINSRYLKLLNTLQMDLFTSSHPALERLMIQDMYRENDSLKSVSIENLPPRLRKLYLLMFIRDADDAAEKAEGLEKEYPFLLNEPEWLFLMSRQFSAAGLTEDASVYVNRLKEQFPQSIESALIEERRVRTYPRPEDYLKNPDVFETRTSVTEDDEAVRVYIQAGAFHNPENAFNFKENLEAYGLECRIVEEGTVYKIIIITGEYEDTAGLLDSLGIKGFRIPRIP